MNPLDRVVGPNSRVTLWRRDAYCISSVNARPSKPVVLSTPTLLNSFSVPVSAFTVDVEDYYHVSAFEGVVTRDRWGQYESRVVASTHRLLDLLDEHRVSGTFYVLGWVAKTCPALVREIDRRGHEIGSHSYWHRLIYELTPEQFRADLRDSIHVLGDVIGRRVDLYRAPSFSIVKRSLWALDILVEEGIRIDSSIFPVRHDRYGLPGAPLEPHIQSTLSGSLVEFPPSVLAIGGVRLPIGGGGYFRLYPRQLTRFAATRANQQSRPFMFYIHPWEIDPRQPRLAGVPWKSRARHYVNLKRAETKLRWLLRNVQFGTVTQVLQQFAPSLLVEGRSPDWPEQRCLASQAPAPASPESRLAS